MLRPKLRQHGREAGGIRIAALVLEILDLEFQLGVAARRTVLTIDGHGSAAKRHVIVTIIGQLVQLELIHDQLERADVQRAVGAGDEGLIMRLRDGVLHRLRRRAQEAYTGAS